MRRAIVILVVGVLGVAVAVYLPYHKGAKAEQHLTALLNRVSENPRVDARLVDYQRGLYQSSAHSLTTVKRDEGEPLEVRLKHTIHHGLRLRSAVKVVTTPELSGESRDRLRPYLGDQAPLTIVDTVGYGGEQEIEVRSPAFEATPKGTPETHITWGGLQGTAELGADLGTAAIHATAPSLEVHNSRANLALKGLELDSELESPGGSLWLGQTRVTGDRLHVLNRQAALPAEREFKADGLYFELGGSRNDDLLSYSVACGADRITAAQSHFANPTLRMELRRLDYQIVRTLLDRMHTLNRQGVPPEQVRQQVVRMLVVNLPRLLQRQLKIAITELSFGTPNGELEGSAHLQYIGQGRLKGLRSLIQDFEGRANLEIPRATLQRLARTMVKQDLAQEDVAPLGREQQHVLHQRVEAQIQRLVAQGLLQESGGAYVASLALQGGRVTLNGQTRPLPGLGMLP